MKITAKYFLNVFVFLVEFFALFFILNLPEANAATLYFNPSSDDFIVGDIFTVNVFVNTEGQRINVAEAKINFPTELDRKSVV